MIKKLTALINRLDNDEVLAIAIIITIINVTLFAARIILNG